MGEAGPGRHEPHWQAATGGAAARPSRRRPRGGSLRGSVPTGVGNGGVVARGAGRTATSCQSARCASSPREAAGHRFASGGLRLRRTTSPLPTPTSLRQRAVQADRLASPGRRRPPGRSLGLGQLAIPGIRRSGPRRPWARHLARTAAARNRARDNDTDRLLAAAGWISFRVWEHEDPQEAALRVRELGSRSAASTSSSTASPTPPRPGSVSPSPETPAPSSRWVPTSTTRPTRRGESRRTGCS
jgi:hypothetical protein